MKMLAYQADERINLEEIEGEDWYTIATNYLDEMREKIKEVMTPDRVTRGSDLPAPSYQDYIIEVLPEQPYKRNGQEIKLVERANLNEVVETIEDVLNKYRQPTASKTRPFEFAVFERRKTPEDAPKKAGIHFVCDLAGYKNLEFDIEFVTYKKDSSSGSSGAAHKKSKKGASAGQRSIPEVTLRFNLKKGLQFKLLKYILLIESALKDSRLTYFK